MLIMWSCAEKQEVNQQVKQATIEVNASHVKSQEMKTQINPELPTIGILIFEGFLTNEVIAPLDVFTKKSHEGEQLFNVVLLAKESKLYKSEEGLKVQPDFTISQAPKLKVLVVPSSYQTEKQTSDRELVSFIKEQETQVDYMASHCAGAFLLGASGVADDQKIVTYVGGGSALKTEYPKLNVQDDQKLAVVEDGKIISSNGNLVSYVASLDLLEKLTSKEQRKKVEDELLIERLVQH